jgi:hypothetical protein
MMMMERKIRKIERGGMFFRTIFFENTASNIKYDDTSFRHDTNQYCDHFPSTFGAWQSL